MIKTIGLLTFMKSPPMHIMPVVAAVTFMMYQKVHLHLDDITVVKPQRVMKGVWEVYKRIELCSTFQNYIHNSHFPWKFVQITV